ncbi:MAG: penicillin-binding protein 2 [Carboxydocellales bacterium]
MQLRPVDKKLNILLALTVVIFAILLSRLAYLQLWQTKKFNLESQSNRIRLTTVTAARGEIKDRFEKVLARSKPAFTVSLALLDLKKEDQEEVFYRLAKILNISIDDIRTAVKEQPLKYEPVRIKTDIPLEVVTKIEEQRMDLPGVIIEIEPLRYYPGGELLAHVLGYTRQTGDEKFLKTMFSEYPQEQYKPADRFGMAGLERWFEPELHGLDGARQVEVDRRMRPVRDLGIKEPIPGNDLILTIDRDLQMVAEDSLVRTMAQVQNEFPNAKAGAVVVVDVRNGDVLAMASKPSFEPNRFNEPISPEEWNRKFSDLLPNPPLLNRAIRAYPPGSTFKMITGLAALESERWDIKRKIFDPGYYPLGAKNFKCWKTSGHGTVDLHRAIQVSCNTFFITAALAAGNVEIARVAQELGLGEKTGITLPGESSGTVPTSEWKKTTNTNVLKWRYETIFSGIEKKYNAKLVGADPEEQTKLAKAKANELKWARQDYERELAWNTKWQSFDTANMAIGQGANNYTPLQLADYVAAIANGGTRYKPQLVKRIVGPDGKVLQEFKPAILGKLTVSPKNLQAIQAGMLAVTQPGGTAAGRFMNFPVKVAGKTGTAQVFGKDNHGLFVGFAPYDKPEIAIAAIVEQGGHGGTSAGVIARDVLAQYFKVNGNQAGTVASPEE